MTEKKVANADYGIDAVHVPQKWYRWQRFPLVPICWYRAEDEYNCADFGFSWLNIRAWTMMSPDIGFEFMVEDMGAYLRLRVPYVNITIWLMYFPQKWHQKLWR